jgi:hypothetical protein
MQELIKPDDNIMVMQILLGIEHMAKLAGAEIDH